MLKVRNLTADLGEFVLKDIDLNVKDGEYFVILGPTASGKTILLEVIAGIYRSDKGKIVLNGKNIADKQPKDRPISMVYQDYMLFPHLTVKENIRFSLETGDYPEKKIESEVERFVELLDISDILHRYPRTLSGGEKQRVALARSLVMEPEVILLDEPVSALDIPSQENIIRELKKIHRETEVSIMHVTHSREEALRLGDRVAVMKEGNISQTGKPFQVFKKPNSDFVANFVGTENVFKGESKVEDGIATVSLNENIEIVAVSDKEGSVKACIRPEEIFVSSEPIDSSVRNMIEGEVVEVSERESTDQLKVDAGLDFTVTVTKKSREDMELIEGRKIYLEFKATAVHLI